MSRHTLARASTIIGATLILASTTLFAKQVFVINASKQCICNGLISCEKVTDWHYPGVSIDVVGRDVETAPKDHAWDGQTTITAGGIPWKPWPIDSKTGAISMREHGVSDALVIPADVASKFLTFTAVEVITPYEHLVELMPASFIDENCHVTPDEIEFARKK